MSGLRLGELCAGYGGLGMAVEAVFNAETAWFSEFDAAPSKILAHHWPEVPNYGDMTKIDWAAIESVDIISGGTPCQDLSAAGRRAGMTEGTRSNLWVQMREAIAIQKPTYVVWENVRGAYSATAASDLEQCPGCMGDAGDGGPVLRALGRVLGDLSDLGYDCQWRGLRAADVGACHGRFRVFVLARNATDPNREGLEVSGPRRFLPSETTSAATFRDQAHVADAYRLGYERGWEARGRRFGLANSGQSAANADHAAGDGERSCQEPWEGSEVAASNPSGNGRQWGQDQQGEGRHSRFWGEALDNPSDSGTSRPVEWGDYEPAIRRWESRLGRPAPRPTEPSGRAGGVRLSPRFTEWMMGLPDGWVTDPSIGISRNEQLKACGNGVVPQQAMAALRDMLAAFQTAEVAA